MGISKAAGIGIFISLLIGAAAGVFGGWQLGVRVFLNGWVQEQAKDVQERINVIRQLRSGQSAQAIEALESRLDDDLVVLEPEGYSLRPYVRAEMHAALREAVRYRAEHPRQSSRAMVDEMVRNALSREIPADGP